ncbi:Glucoamylase P [Pestalotiopsis fici W106-1]|uniref:glucan 1,4-alpha-glucosidase n=1 Tax=Pestalotiopsis fici (strain W106-1 / CGMCC3.15140) TaxID=1229662 RepID=W3WNP0_PESFW|nr:Glucoamylase P [Pestalotiopsis fici W106-1]ETS75535.1 Glucoamylase P [Pestalotiopsis fici W106-1]
MVSAMIKIATTVAAFTAVTVARPSIRQTSTVDAFIDTERPIALQGILNNIGPDGAKVEGASAGIVVASPSTVDPDYFYTWTRDSALTLKTIIDEFIFSGDTTLQTVIDNYVQAQAFLQTVDNPSGSLSDGSGLAEPKFYSNETQFTDAWGRPQRDGPALRAIALIAYSNWLVDNGQQDTATSDVWPIISNDLSYVGQYWNQTTFDLWEEVQGSSFFTTQNQYRSLIEGSALATTLGVTCTGCDQAPQILCFLQSYWNGEFLTANINVNNGRSGHDANTFLGSIAIFDVDASCSSSTFQPCSSKSLSSFKAYIDSFSGVYSINDGVAAGTGIAIGRYPEDTYQGGNPWYLITAGAAEFLYDAVAQWTAQQTLTIDDTSLSFFTTIYSSATAGTYAASDAAFTDILSAVTAYADSFVAVVQQYTPSDGSLAEQFGRDQPASPLSATDLTWSYAAFVTMAQRRAGQYPAGWEGASPAEVPDTCSSSSTPGTYAPAPIASAAA